MRSPSKDDWLNAIVGILDIAFHLTDDEQFLVSSIVGQLLEGLDIPDRSTPTAVPAAVALEMEAGVYSDQLATDRTHGLVRTVRAAQQLDIVASLATWREAIMGMILTAYPDIKGIERSIAVRIVTDLLSGIGVPTRAAAAYPDEVMRLYQQMDAPRF